MTVTLTRRSGRSAGFQSPAVFWPVVGATATLAGAAAVTGPAGPAAVVVVLAVLVLVGIPHGSVDHLLADRRPAVAFQVGYVLAMAGYGLVWLVAPPVALIGFLLLSIHHFGQSDLAYLGLDRWRQLPIQWSRGLFLIGLPLVAHLSIVTPVVQRLGGGDVGALPWLADRWALWAALLVAQHLVVGAVVAPALADRAGVRREAVGVAVLTVLFLVADPLVGFAVYFGLWHSLAHLIVLADVLGDRAAPPKTLGARRLARLAAPRTALSLGGLGALAGAALAIDRPDLVLPAAFVLVSVLTLPHMVVVELLWRRSPPSWARGDREGMLTAAGNRDGGTTT